jgi:hypothetical protein
MENHEGCRTPALAGILFVVVVIVVILAITPFQTVGGTPGPVATYSQGKLHVAIPYSDARPGTGQLTVEVLDPEDKILGRTQHKAEIIDQRGAGGKRSSLTNRCRSRT